MPTPTLANVPKNQLDALPIDQTGGTAGAAVVIGNSMQRFWSPTALGLSGITGWTTDGFGNIYIVTPFLEVLGCTNFVMQMRCITSIVRVALPSTLLFSQYRLTSADSIPPFGTNNNAENAAMSQIGLGKIFAAALAGDQQVVDWAWSVGRTGSPEPSVVIGSDVRFVIQSAGPVPAATNSFSVSLWGSG